MRRMAFDLARGGAPLCSAAWPAMGGLSEQRRFMRPASQSEIRQALNTLNVDINTKEGDLKKAYLKMVRENHPDKGGSEAKMKDITTSYNLLKGLSRADKQAFKTAGGSYSPGGGRAQDTYRRANYSNPHDAHEAYRRKYEQQQKSYYKHDPNMNNYNNAYRGHSNPFAQGPFPATARNMRGMPTPVLMMRALFIYTILSVTFLMFYRAYKDYTHDDGWVASQAAWRAERMEGLQNLRDAARARSELREREWMERRRRDTATAREQRAMDYARRREQEMQSADNGCFPRLNPEGLEGLVMRDYNDPPGIAYFVPPLANGAPPFSGNGRYMYSTGSVPRNQCVPTVRERPAAPGGADPTLAPTARRSRPATLGELASDARAQRQAQAAPVERRVVVKDANVFRPDSERDPSHAGHVRGTSETVKGFSGSLSSLDAAKQQQQHQQHTVQQNDAANGDEDDLPPMTLRNGGVGLDLSSAQQKPGFHGNLDAPESSYGRQQPLNMRRRPYVPPGVRAEVVGPAGYDPSEASQPLQPDGMIQKRQPPPPPSNGEAVRVEIQQAPKVAA